jgi:biofilm PGA synthesis lipoprotein PgaB
MKRLTVFGLLCLLALQPARAEVIALCYHDVTATTEEALKDETAVSVSRLVGQFNWLLSHGYTPISLKQLLDSRAGDASLPPNPVLLTFDDGYRSFYDKVLPLLELYGFPAVLAPVTSWVDAGADRPILYGDTLVPREKFLDWDQIREIADSGLVEIASHSHDLHRGIVANPQGNTQPAATSLAYDPNTGRYEEPAELVARVHEDLQKSVALLEQEVGYRPRAMVWPYGEYGVAAQLTADWLGMGLTMTLDDQPNSADDPSRVHRLLLGSDMDLSEFATAIRDLYTPTPLRAAHVDLDYVYDPDPLQQEQNLGELLDRIKAMNISTVILQAYADPDGDGAADALYFPNRHLPVRSDLFNRAAWQLKTRTGVNVYAWLPVLAYLDPRKQHVVRVQSADDNYEVYSRLSPFVEENVRYVEEIYSDLAAASEISGILFHDDAVLTDYEDASEAALSYYADQWGLPQDLGAIRADHADAFSRLKTEHLIEITDRLTTAVRTHRPAIRTARNLYAPVLLTPESEHWFAQNFSLFLEAYDYTALMAMPYLEEAPSARQWLEEVAELVAAYPNGLEKTLFEIQTWDWRSGRALNDEELAAHLDLLLNRGARHIAYYPDDFITGHPTLEMLRSRLSVNGYAALIE